VAAPAYVQLTTARGSITVELDVAHAPISARNFLRYVDARRFDGVSFYRALNLGQGYGLIQAGTRGAPAITFPPIAHEPTSRTGLSHTDGAISFARAAPGSANGDFFITIGALTSLDAQPAGSGGDPAGFAVFGRIVAGMDTVRAILAAPTDPNAGVGVMRGQMIAAPIRITTARRVTAPPPAPVAPPAPPASVAPAASPTPPPPPR
jgi:peptidyl-prolyl cis-trans isomerase A (cyclophilin A)